MKANHTQQQEPLEMYEDMYQQLEYLEEEPTDSDTYVEEVYQEDNHLNTYHITLIPSIPTNSTIRGNLECIHAWYGNTKEDKVYAISDSGADATILGKNCHIVSYTGRTTTIVGYEKSTTCSPRSANCYGNC